jgi:Na+/H+-translocating membrane pyrophosphatase
MIVATDANVSTTQAADKHGLAVALRVAFTGGSIMGFTVVGFGLLGLSIMFVLVAQSGPWRHEHYHEVHLFR